MMSRAGLASSLLLAGTLAGGAAAVRAQEPAPLPRPADLSADEWRSNVKGTQEFQRRLKEELEAAKGDRAKLTSLLVETTARIQNVERQLMDLEARVGTLDRNAERIRASLVARKDVLAEVLAALMRMGRQPPPALLMRPDDALDAVRSAILLGALLPELRVEAETLAADLSDLTRTRTELMAARTTLTLLRNSLEEDRGRLSALVEERQRRQAEDNPLQSADKAQATSLARTSGDVHDLVTRLETEVAPSARAADAAKSAPAAAPGAKADPAALKNTARLAPAMAFSEAKGLLPLPVAGVSLKGFGAADAVGGHEKGVTFATRPGAPVSAPADGWVVYAGPFRSYGQLLIINAGGGYHILMAGMERITVELGQFVLTGEPVAVMSGAPNSPTPRAVANGDKGSGAAIGQPQLYVEFRKDGVSIDPAPWWVVTDRQKVRG